MTGEPLRIAFLCKRRYMSKDVIVDRYARLYEIPLQLARLGHDVRGFCLSYQGGEDGRWTHDGGAGSLRWESRALRGAVLPAVVGYPWRLLRQLRRFSPDVIIGASDIPHVVLGAWVAARLRVRFVADLYDNFEGFGQARVPGMVPLLRRAVRAAALVTTTSEPLRRLVIDEYHATGDVMAMPSTVDKAVFHPRDKAASRRSLGLPDNAFLIGTAGGLHREKGVDALYTAWHTLSEQRADAHLVLAGPLDPQLSPPTGPRVHYLGQLAHARTAELFSALDIGVIYLRDTPFGRFCFPQKAYEMLACGLPLVAARVGVMHTLLEQDPTALYAPDQPDELARAVLAKMDGAVPPALPIDDWAQLVGAMEKRMQRAIGRRASVSAQ